MSAIEKLELAFIVGLIVILFAQQIIWAKICLELTNRLMSRNYFEHQQAQALSKPSAQPHQMDETVDLDAERQASAANAVMGLI